MEKNTLQSFPLKDEMPHKYSVGIIEDNEFEYERLSNGINEYSHFRLEKSIKPLNAENYTDFKSFCKKLIKSSAQIFVVDWELKNEETGIISDPNDIVQTIKEIDPEFDFAERYWILCTAKKEYALAVLNKLDKVFDRNSIDFFSAESKTRLYQREYQSLPDYRLKILEKGSQYLQGVFDSKHYKYLPTLEDDGNLLELVDIDGAFYDLDKGSEERRSKSLLITAERFICFVNYSNTGLLLYLNDSGKLKIHGVKLEHGSRKKIGQQLENYDYSEGMYYNPSFFERAKERSTAVVIAKELRALTRQKLIKVLDNPVRYSDDVRPWYKHSTNQREQLAKVKGILRDKLIMP